MTRCLFASDLHGDRHRYTTLAHTVAAEAPDAVFLGGDLFPPRTSLDPAAAGAFVRHRLAAELSGLRREMTHRYPRIFLILGNDDERAAEPAVLEVEGRGLVEYVHQRRTAFGRFQIYGYACIPPTAFLLKDWERYDVSRYVDPGCVSPEEGRCSSPVSRRERRHNTIKADLERLAGQGEADRAVFLFHAPPYRTGLDRAALDDVRVDGVPLDVHIGSIAMRRFIEERQPLVTLHGHVHESARLTGAWRDRIGRTHLFTAAHDGPELALVRFTLEHLDDATRELL